MIRKETEQAMPLVSSKPGCPDMQKLLLRALSGEQLDVPPIWLMRQAGRYLPEYRAVREKAGGFLDLCYTPDFAVEVTLQPIRRFGFDAAILFSDILVVPDGLGQKVWFEEGAGPRLEPVSSADGLVNLSLDGLTSHLAPVYETVRRLRQELPAETALIGFAGAPWTVATYMVAGQGSPDQAAARLWSYRAPDEFGTLIGLLVDATCAHLKAQIEAGAEVVQLFDTWAGALPPAEFIRWVIEPTKAIVAELKVAYPDIPVIGFPRGAGPFYCTYVAETGVGAVGLDTTVSAEWAHAELQADVCVQGNLDPLALVAGGDAMRAAVGNILDNLRGGPFVFNLGHGIVPQTPPEHVAELVALVRGAA